MTSKKTIDDVLNLINEARENEDELIKELNRAKELNIEKDTDKQLNFAMELSNIAMRDGRTNIKLIASAFIVQLTQKTMEDIDNIQDTQEMYNIARTLKTCLELYEEC